MLRYTIKVSWIPNTNRNISYSSSEKGFNYNLRAFTQFPIDCTLYNVNVFDTQNETAEPTINWDNKNWFIMGPYLYFAHTQSDDIGSAGKFQAWTFLFVMYLKIL